MNIIEITERFPTELDAIKYFEKQRFGKKPRCAYCDSEKLSKRTKDHRFKCYDCNRTTSVTDQLPSYRKMDTFIERVVINHKKLYSYKGINTNTIESFWAIIKRQIMGQHHHVTPRHLPKYVAEAVFKYNNRKEDDMFETLVKNSMLEVR